MAFLYITVAGVLGLIFFGPIGIGIGVVVGILFGAPVSNNN
jgi:hypothetical protein